MTDAERLRQRIDASGYKKRFIAEKLGLSYQGFLNKLWGASDFRVSEIRALCDLLSLTAQERDAIFF